ncbi:MAG: transketolase [Oscillospiraceae bacterium]|nr:transketolase [Oscillospiraceae bacterium]
MSIYETNEVRVAAKNIRKTILGLAINRGGAYLGQACSCADILAALYLRVLNFGPSLGAPQAMPFPGAPSPANMDYQKGAAYHGAPDKDRDRLFVSPAHYASVVYCALAEAGRISHEAIEKFNVDGWNMEMIGAEHSPGFECTAGSLGQTVSIAAGTAHGRRLKGESGRVFVFLSDGELQSGQAWEAFQAASFYRLENLIAYVDVNGLQVEGYTKDVMDISPLEKRLEAFGWKALVIDGHNEAEIVRAAETLHPGQPMIVLCHTSSACGVPLLEKRMPFLHFVGIGSEEIEVFKKFHADM